MIRPQTLPRMTPSPLKCVRGTIENKPSAEAAVALGIGCLIGKMRRSL